MNGSTENRASGASRAGGSDVVLTWATARRMLPLVQRIVQDVLQHLKRLAALRPEKDRLDRQKRTLDWPARSRRYQLQDEINHEEQSLQLALAELEGLGVTLINAEDGQVGFPTTVNNRRAFFSWRLGEEELGFWHFDGDVERRPVPISWTKPVEVRKRGK